MEKYNSTDKNAKNIYVYLKCNQVRITFIGIHMGISLDPSWFQN